MKRILNRLPPEIAARVHPDWQKNEKSYWAKRVALLPKYEGQWIGFADDTVIASGDRPVQVLHATQRTGRHPFVTCVGHEDTPQRMRRSIYSYDSTYPGEPLPRVAVDFRSAPGGPGATFEDVIPDTGADASVLPWLDCQALRAAHRRAVRPDPKNNLASSPKRMGEFRVRGQRILGGSKARVMQLDG